VSDRFDSYMAHFYFVKNYEFIEHTADIGIRVKGDNLKGLFRNAALAMFDIIAEQKKPEVKGTKKTKIKLQADGTEELFISWLNELLSLSAIKELIFSDFKISKLDKKKIEAILIGRANKDYRINTEVKAATYHQLKIEYKKTDWQAEVIFDV